MLKVKIIRCIFDKYLSLDVLNNFILTLLYGLGLILYNSCVLLSSKKKSKLLNNNHENNINKFKEKKIL